MVSLVTNSPEYMCLWRQQHPQYKEKQREYLRIWRQKHPEHEVKHRRRQRLFRARHPNYYQEYRQNHPEVFRESSRRWYQSNKERRNKLAVIRNLAQRKVKLDVNCEICDSTENLERHHPDYSKPLVVQTLCKPCHNRLDKGVD